MKTKKCTKCGIEKPLTEFHKRSASKDGHCSRCRECRLKYMAEYHSRPEVKENLLEYNSRPEVKEKKCQRSAERYSQNKEEILNQLAEYRSKRKSEQPNCVYQIYNSINGKIYIGETTRGKLRWKKHLRDLRGNRHKNKQLQEDFNKCGEDAFEWTILKEFERDDKDALLLEEAKTIQQYIQDGFELYNEVLNLKMLEENKDIE